MRLVEYLSSYYRVLLTDLEVVHMQISRLKEGSAFKWLCYRKSFFKVSFCDQNHSI